MSQTRRLSATALSCFLKSPRQYYYRYVLGLQPILPQVANYDHDLVFGSLWHEFTDRFYTGVPEAQNSPQTMQDWLDKTEGWVPEKPREKLTKAFEVLCPQYYQMFRPDDGVRGAGSELWLENDRFVAKLDGLSTDKVIHEVKSTSRAQSIADQLWKVQHSLQVRLYCVLTQANGHCIEFAYKDPPYQIFRGPVEPVNPGLCQIWERELNALADTIYALGDNPDHYPCHTDSCCMTSRFSTSMCAFQLLCDQGLTTDNMLFYKQRESQQQKQKGVS
jgi:hypothetical protein